MKLIIENIDLIKGKETEIIGSIAPYYSQKYKELAIRGGRQLLSAQEELLSGYMLYQNLGIVSDSQLVRDTHGKPYIRENKNSIYFNLSHSTGCVALAISDKPVGVDIERVDRMKWQTIRRILPKNDEKKYEILEKEYEGLANELRYLEKNICKEKRFEDTEEIQKIKSRIYEIKTRFAERWTSYEAMIKHIGCGFAKPLDEKTRLELEGKISFKYIDEYVIAVV